MTRDARAAGDVQMVGIVEEQHPDRARLFMQWQEMDWPLLVDAQNRLGVKVVPITLLIDEAGVIRFSNPRRGRAAAVLAEFLALPPAVAAGTEPVVPVAPPLAPLEERAGADDTAAAWRAYGEALVEWGGPSRLTAGVAALQRAVERDGNEAMTHFRLGVALRRRSETVHRMPGDFQRAVVHWTEALARDPNQYIWRRRIQQYGPRLDKPYPFYDWVATARDEIEARGDRPLALGIEPGGTELARPARGPDPETDPDAGPEVEAVPDPDLRVHRDVRGFIDHEVVCVRHTAGDAVRVHLRLEPSAAIAAHWNNEAEPLVVWLDPPPGWTVDRRIRTGVNPPAATSREVRRMEFELRPEEGAGAGTFALHALYNVCEGERGTCLFRRTDIIVPLAPGR